MIAFLSRVVGPFQTTSQFVACDGDNIAFTCKVLEPENNKNKKNISCIPIGDYWVKRHNSKKYGECFIIEDVIDRDNILFHWGNFRKDTKGCSIVGSSFKDIDGDGFKDVFNSKETFNRMMKIMPDRWMLIIRSDNENRND